MEEKIHKMLILCDFISVIVTLWEFFIVHSWGLGTVLGLITILLNLLLCMIKNKNKIISLINYNSFIINGKKAIKNYFFIITIVYIICNGSILLYSIFGEMSVGVMFLLFISLPVCYSLLILIFVFLTNISFPFYGKIQEIIAPFPHYIFIINSIFIKGIFYKILGIVVAGILYAPVCAVTLYVCDEINKVSEKKNVPH